MVVSIRGTKAAKEETNRTKILNMSQYQKRFRTWRAAIDRKTRGGSQETMYTPAFQSQVFVHALEGGQ
jgi:hypothetical protein